MQNQAHVNWKPNRVDKLRIVQVLKWKCGLRRVSSPRGRFFSASSQPRNFDWLLIPAYCIKHEKRVVAAFRSYPGDKWSAPRRPPADTADISPLYSDFISTARRSGRFFPSCTFSRESAHETDKAKIATDWALKGGALRLCGGAGEAPIFIWSKAFCVFKGR